ncbi:hypothetical protein [Poseidonocella sp. HB161398]|uniref:hypothetical protein n=1 Tax=Poseidonocella sp. HB161398 TaxID=2320855 RepID=UPI001107CE04|nr:hypothetical protein [Poseidonocella sp. HB161398]
MAVAVVPRRLLATGVGGADMARLGRAQLLGVEAEALAGLRQVLAELLGGHAVARADGGAFG